MGSRCRVDGIIFGSLRPDFFSKVDDKEDALALHNTTANQIYNSDGTHSQYREEKNIFMGSYG